MLEGDWEPGPESAHPRARELIGEDFFGDVGDDNSPFGNDTGSDTPAHLRRWRAEHQREPVSVFLQELLESWEVEDDHWSVESPEEVAQLIEEDEMSFTTRDEALIAVALGQLVLEGKVDADIRQRALVALRRQALEPALALWPDGHAGQRRERLSAMETVLRRA